jgi:ABC-type glutathione transport system ATPase component
MPEPPPPTRRLLIASTGPDLSGNILEARDIRVEFTTGRGPSRNTVVALNGVSLDIRRGSVFGLVGESGSGKSTFARVATALQPYSEGTLRFDGEDLPQRRTRSQQRQIQMVFQDPYASLDPRMTVRQMLTELLRYHHVVDRAGLKARCSELMDLVQLPARSLDSYPISMSGGQRQRVAIARALSLEPSLLVADEAVSALDVSVQAGIVNLLSDLKDDLNLSILFIAHDLAVVRNLCDRVAVIYRGDIVEEAPTADLFSAPQHEYTQRLLASIPRLGGQRTTKMDMSKYGGAAPVGR